MNDPRLPYLPIGKDEEPLKLGYMRIFRERFYAWVRELAKAVTDNTPVYGSWTPSIGGSATYNGQYGRYKKHGKSVTVWGQLAINVIGTGSTTTVSGLPFVSATGNGVYAQAGAVGYFATLNVSVASLIPVVNNAAQTVQFAYVPAGGAVGVTFPGAIFKSGTEVNFAITYEIA